jgi:hypothetical protein
MLAGIVAHEILLISGKITILNKMSNTLVWLSSEKASVSGRGACIRGRGNGVAYLCAVWAATPLLGSQ